MLMLENLFAQIESCEIIGLDQNLNVIVQGIITNMYGQNRLLFGYET